jgi:hypothetical protein
MFFIFVRLKEVKAVSVPEKNAEKARQISMIISSVGIKTPYKLGSKMVDKTQSIKT